MTSSLPKSLVDNPRISIWLSFAKEGRVLVQTGKMELGQGITTALSQIAAEELDVGLDRIDVASGRTADGPNEGFTVGSYSIEVGGGALRLAASAARRLFSEVAASLLQVPPDEIAVNDGAFLKNGLTTGLSYWTLAPAVDLDVDAAPIASPKPRKAYRVVGQPVSQRPLYDVPNVSVRKRVAADFPIRTSSLRTLGAHTNVFAIEMMMDELAERTGCDALEFRLRHLSDERAKSVLRRVAGAASWPASASPASSIGLGFARYKNTAAYCAVAAEVSIEDQVRLRHVWACVDAGLAINPDGIANQIEGGVIQAASWTLTEALPFDANGIAAQTWEAYPILKFSAVPAVTVEIIDDPTLPSLGVGEAAQGPTTAAIANAVARALGVRVRDLPLTRDKLMSAIAGA